MSRIRIGVIHGHWCIGVGLFMREFLCGNRFAFFCLFGFVRVEFLLFLLSFLLIELFEYVNNSASFVVAAVFAHGMGADYGFTVAAQTENTRLQGMMRPHAVPLRFGMAHSDYHMESIAEYMFLCKLLDVYKKIRYDYSARLQKREVAGMEFVDWMLWGTAVLVAILALLAGVNIEERRKRFFITLAILILLGVVVVFAHLHASQRSAKDCRNTKVETGASHAISPMSSESSFKTDDVWRYSLFRRR